MSGPPEVRLREGPGVPVFWAPVAGLVTGALVCRVGEADETLPVHGITHLVEHLALGPLGRPAYDFNGHVDGAFTGFHASGTLEEVTGFLEAVAGGLRDLPLDRLEREKRILRTEAEGRAPGVGGRLLALRYGAHGYGLVSHGELGVDWLDEGRVRAWAQERFVTAGAAVWLSAEPPEAFAIELHDGSPPGPPPVEPLPGLRWPAHLADGTGGVALSLLAERSAAVHLAGAVAVDRAHDRLREGAGLSYGVGGAYEPLDARRAHLVFNADCQDRDGARVRHELRGVLDELAEAGPEPAELEALCARAVRDWDDPTRALALLDDFARDHLLGRERAQAAELQREREATIPEEVAAALREALATLLVLVPESTKNDDEARHATYGGVDPPVVDGDVLPTPAEWQGWGQRTELVVGEAGISVRDPDGTAVTWPWDACVAGVRSLGDSITLVRRDGTWLAIHPRRYKGGVRAGSLVLERLGPERIVPLNDRGRELEPVVHEQLGDEGIARVGEELDGLVPSLDADEALRHLASAVRGDQTGLVALTDRRLLFLFAGAQNFDLTDLALGAIRGAHVKGLLGKRLVVEADEPLELRDVRPEGRMDELAAALTAVGRNGG